MTRASITPAPNPARTLAPWLCSPMRARVTERGLENSIRTHPERVLERQMGRKRRQALSRSPHALRPDDGDAAVDYTPIGAGPFEETNACKFFVWVDPATCPRGLDYGRHLQEKIKELEKKEDNLERLNEVMEKDLQKMMKKMDKLMRINNELKKKNEVMWKCNVLAMVVIGVLLVVWLGNWKHTNGKMLYLP
ncbi:hypothetical protein RHMOL_Rhmol04G0143500 [Rhododendron molle]|uniref:Uncharacterized protein n=1 Tax=Rhododendron molle TaxID=49168 RepID=A0ACC0P1I1_RHOML|nr:hypothetical protein RHMOL_Rhmol04G0143500 [Rhododendron molle]